MAFWRGRFESVTFITCAGMEGGVAIGTIELGFPGGRAETDEFDNHGFSVPASEICFEKYLYLANFLRIMCGVAWTMCLHIHSATAESGRVG
jgi:hypothetical protein